MIMKNTKNNKLLKNLLTSTFMMTFAWQVQAKVVDEIEKEFSVSAGSHFSLDNINGSVNINAWDKQVITVTALIKADDQESRDRISIDMQQNGSEVTVETHYKKNSSWGNDSSGSVSYTINVPKDVSLAAINLVNGSLAIKNVEGKIKAELVNGSIKAKGLMSNSEINSVNGSIKVSYNKQASNFDKIDLQTVNGSIKLLLPKTVSASIEAETTHGSIKNNLGLSAEKGFFSGKSLSGTVGSGDAKISLESVNGSIKISKN